MAPAQPAAATDGHHSGSKRSALLAGNARAAGRLIRAFETLGSDDTQELRTGHGTGFQLPVRAGEAGTCRRTRSYLRASGRSATALLLGEQRSDAVGVN